MEYPGYLYADITLASALKWDCHIETGKLLETWKYWITVPARYGTESSRVTIAGT